MKLTDVKSGRFPCIYCLTFPDGKQYVGKAHRFSERVKLYTNEKFKKSGRVNEAISKFGADSVEVEILSRVNCPNDIDLELCLSIMEIKYIREKDSVYPKGYNVSLGGECLGIPVEHITTDSDTIRSYNSGKKVILEYDVDGNFVAEYPSIARFAYENGINEDAVRSAVDAQRALNGKHILRSKRYGFIPDKISVREIKVVNKVKYKTVVEEVKVEKIKEVYHNGKRVIAYDIDGDFVGEYESLADMRRNLGIRSSIATGIYNSGYIAYEKVSDDYPKKIESYEEMIGKVTESEYHPASELKDIPPIPMRELIGDKHGGMHANLKLDFKIAQYSLNGEPIDVYNSIRDAAYRTGLSYSGIYGCVNGKTRKSQGYIWRRLE